MGRSKSLTAVVIVAATLASQGVEGAEGKGQRLAPTSPWNINYDADSCRLGRVFGEGRDQVALYLERYAPAEGFALLVAGAPLDRLRYANKVVMRFGPGETEQEDGVVVGELGSLKPALVVSSITFYGDDNPEASARKMNDEAGPTPPFLSWDELAEREKLHAAGINWLGIDLPARRQLVLELGSMGKPMAALRDCTRELVTHWGLDAAKQASLRHGPIPTGNPGAWISDNSYPRELLRKGSEGIVQFRLIVDATGAPTSCHIQKSTRPVGFDDVVCAAMMRHAHFNAAIDSEGNPVASYFRSTVRFQIAP